MAMNRLESRFPGITVILKHLSVNDPQSADVLLEALSGVSPQPYETPGDKQASPLGWYLQHSERLESHSSHVCWKCIRFEPGTLGFVSARLRAWTAVDTYFLRCANPICSGCGIRYNERAAH